MENFYLTPRQNHFSDSYTNFNRKFLRLLKAFDAVGPNEDPISKSN